MERPTSFAYVKLLTENASKFVDNIPVIAGVFIRNIPTGSTVIMFGFVRGGSEQLAQFFIRLGKDCIVTVHESSRQQLMLCL